MQGPEECQLEDGTEMGKAWSLDMERTRECPEVEQGCQSSEENYYVTRKFFLFCSPFGWV